MINARPYAGRTTRDARALLVALALSVVLLGLLVITAVAANSPAFLSRGQSFVSGSFAPSQHADYGSAGDRPVAPQRPVR